MNGILQTAGQPGRGTCSGRFHRKLLARLKRVELHGGAHQRKSHPFRAGTVRIDGDEIGLRSRLWSVKPARLAGTKGVRHLDILRWHSHCYVPYQVQPEHPVGSPGRSTQTASRSRHRAHQVGVDTVVGRQPLKEQAKAPGTERFRAPFFCFRKT